MNNFNFKISLSDIIFFCLMVLIFGVGVLIGGKVSHYDIINKNKTTIEKVKNKGEGNQSIIIESDTTSQKKWFEVWKKK